MPPTIHMHADTVHTCIQLIYIALYHGVVMSNISTSARSCVLKVSPTVGLPYRITDYNTLILYNT